jgi:hypothetical protein
MQIVPSAVTIAARCVASFQKELDAEAHEVALAAIDTRPAPGTPA